MYAIEISRLINGCKKEDIVKIKKMKLEATLMRKLNKLLNSTDHNAVLHTINPWSWSVVLRYNIAIIFY